MTIEQTVDIPASHWITVEVPREIPAGPAILAFRPAIAAKSDKAPAIEDVRLRLQQEMAEQGTFGVYAEAGDGWTAHVREHHAEP